MHALGGTPDQNKSAFRRLLAEVDAGNLDIIRELYDPAYVDHAGSETRGSEPGPEHLIGVFERLRRAFPDTRHTLHSLVAEGDLVVARTSATGTHTGSIAGIQPTGRTVTLTSTAIYRFVDGRIVERWCDNPPSVIAALRTYDAEESS